MMHQVRLMNKFKEITKFTHLSIFNFLLQIHKPKYTLLNQFDFLIFNQFLFLKL